MTIIKKITRKLQAGGSMDAFTRRTNPGMVSVFRNGPGGRQPLDPAQQAQLAEDQSYDQHQQQRRTNPGNVSVFRNGPGGRQTLVNDPQVAPKMAPISMPGTPIQRQAVARQAAANPYIAEQGMFDSIFDGTGANQRQQQVPYLYPSVTAINEQGHTPNNGYTGAQDAFNGMSHEREIGIVQNAPGMYDEDLKGQYTDGPNGMDGIQGSRKVAKPAAKPDKDSAPSKKQESKKPPVTPQSKQTPKKKMAKIDGTPSKSAKKQDTPAKKKDTTTTTTTTDKKPAAKKDTTTASKSKSTSKKKLSPFETAFAKARSESKKVFSFNGKSYNTKRKDGKPLPNKESAIKAPVKKSGMAKLDATPAKMELAKAKTSVADKKQELSNARKAKRGKAKTVRQEKRSSNKTARVKLRAKRRAEKE